MESFQLELHPERGPVYISLFKNVKNAAELRQRLLNQDASLKCALVNATLVCDCSTDLITAFNIVVTTIATNTFTLTLQVVNTFQILLAINKAIHKEVTGKLKTHKINSEIVYDFSSSNNVCISKLSVDIRINPSYQLIFSEDISITAALWRVRRKYSSYCSRDWRKFIRCTFTICPTPTIKLRSFELTMFYSRLKRP